MDRSNATLITSGIFMLSVIMNNTLLSLTGMPAAVVLSFSLVTSALLSLTIFLILGMYIDEENDEYFNDSNVNDEYDEESYYDDYTEEEEAYIKLSDVFSEAHRDMDCPCCAPNY